MRILFISITVALTLSLSIISYGQTTIIDTIPFSLDKGLLVFKGSINGVPTDFAFDTGASISVSNSNVDEQTGIQKRKGNIKAKDANQTVVKTQKIRIDHLKIGSHSFSDIKSISTDMLFLHCNRFLLLGQDIIKALHWKIDFTQKVLYVSKQAFAVNNESTTWPVTYKNSRPYVSLQLNEKKITNCLIDFGYTGVLDINDIYPDIKNIVAKKQLNGKTNEFYSASMGLAGLGKSEKEIRFLLDSIYLHDKLFTDVEAVTSLNTQTKIGIGFFKNYCSAVILNFTNNEIYVETRAKPQTTNSPFDARVAIKEGKFVVSDININKNSTAYALSLGEEIKSIDGKLVTDYESECSFLMWNYFNKQESILFEKMNGAKVLIKRTSNF